MVRKLYKQLLTGFFLFSFVFYNTDRAEAQVTVKTVNDNFTSFTQSKNYTDLEKLTELTPLAFRNHPDYGKCFANDTSWYEQLDKRTLKTRRYVSEGGRVIIQYGYDNLNYVDNNGWMCAVDTKLKPAENGWAVKQQENPAYLYTDASTSLSIGNGQLVTFNKNVQFNSAAINTATKTVGDDGMIIKNVAANTDKIIRFKRNTIETDYKINKPLNISGDLIISEDILLPAGYSIVQNDKPEVVNEAGSLAVVGPDGKIKAVLKVPACYDKSKSEIIGTYHIQKQPGGYRLAIDVPSSWINSSSRKYPVTIDPVITGTTTEWSGYKIASCLYPNFGSGSMNVEIPADVTITGFYIQASYYANPLDSETLDNGLIYFGSKCGSTGLISINPPQGDSSGTGVVPLTDFHGSLSCCVYPSCSPQSINLTMYMSRLAGGSACDSQYIYYDPANTGGSPFEAYIVGNTIELNNSEWSVSPTTTCSNDCNLTLSATINYGVPPYTISHPWADSSVMVGKYDTSICSSTGSFSITLTRPHCPVTACTTTLLSVPAPTITDACGTVVSGLTFKFITVKPAPKVTAIPDSQKVCSGDPFDVSLTSCVSGATFTWTGSDGSSGSGSPIVDSVPNPSDSAKTVKYTISSSAGGCTGTPDTIPVTVEPIPTSEFTITPPTVCMNGKLSVSYTGASFAGAVYNWNFGGATLLSGSATGPGPDTISFDSAGTYAISLYVTANGCTSKITIDSVRIKPNPVVAVTPTPATICIGNPASLSASGANSYTWTPSTGLSSTTGSSVSANDTITTIYFITGKDTNGCVNTIMDTVNVNPKPTIIANPNPATYCPGGSSILTASGGITYSWSPSTALSATTGDTIIANPTTTTTYIVTGTNSNGCKDTASVIVTVNLKPLITATPTPAFYCPGGSSTIIASGGKTYAWTPSTGLNDTTGDTVLANPTITTTYTIIGMSEKGCLDTNTVVITVDSTPIIMVSPTPATICSGKSTTLSASGANTYTWTPSTGLSSTMGASVSASDTSTTIYFVTGKDGNGCLATIADTVNVNANPKIIANPNPASYCPGGSSTLIASGGVTYAWSPSTGLSAVTGDTVIATPTATTTYMVIGANLNGCTDTAIVIVTVNLKPVITVSPNAPSYCPGGNAMLIASGGNSYTWSPSNALNATTGDTVTANPTITTTYTIIGTTLLGCADTNTVTVTANSNPVINVTPTPDTICSGSPSTLSASGAANYMWSPSSSLNASSGSPVIATPTVSTTYTIIGVSLAGCEDTINVSISVNPLPNIIATPPTAKICFTDSVNLTVSGGITYNWSPTSGLSAMSGSLVTATPVNTTNYTVTGTDANGCIDTASIFVTVIPTPIITFTPPNPIACIGNNATLIASGLYNYIWTPASGLTSSGDSAFIANPTITSTYTVNGTDSNGCIAAATTVTLKVDSNPKGMVTPDSALICEGVGTTLTTSGASTYSWSPSAGLSASSGSSVIASPLIATTYTVIGVDTNGCKDTVNVSIAVNPKPVITIIPLGVVKTCINDSVSLKANGGSTYAWSPSTGLSTTSGSSVIAIANATTRYLVTGTDTNGCIDTSSVLDTIVPGPILTIFPADTQLCIGGNVTLVASGALTYTWSPSPGLSCTTCSNPIASPTVTSTYVVKSTNTFCPGYDSISVKIDTIPSLSVSKDTILCQLTPVQLNALTGGAMTWSPSTGLSCTTCDNPVANPDSTTTYVAETKNGACLVTDSVTVLINIFTFSIGPDQHIIYSGTAQLSAKGAVHYKWTPSGTLNIDTISNPVANPTTTTTYYVTGTDSLGCSSIDSVIVFVGSPCQLIKIPNAFTPNSDENQYFHVLSRGDVSLYYFKVYNRWGQVVYQTNNINDRGWDGTYNGKPQSIGTYVYEAEIDCEGRTMYLHGSVALIR